MTDDPITRAAAYKRMAEEHQRTADTYRTMYEEACMEAYKSGKKESDDGRFKLSVRNPTGFQRSMNPLLFRSMYEDAYNAILQEKLQTYEPSINKNEAISYFTSNGKSEKDAKELVDAACDDKPTKVTYTLSDGWES